ncbi:MAG: hypothetical protein AB8H80_17115 [Planctomycetota bacterium]
MRQLSLVIAPLLITTLSLAAVGQSRVIPSHTTIANGCCRYRIGTDAYGFRWQILVDAGAIAPTGGVLNGISFRSDDQELKSAMALSNVTVSLSHSPMSTAAMSTTFASNATGPVTTVFQGSLNLPGTSTPAAGPSSWDVVVPFAAPYTFTAAQGSLLIEIVKPGLASSSTTPIGYFLDSVCGGGSAKLVGVQGTSPSPTWSPALRVGSSYRALATGSTITFASIWGALPFIPPGPGVIGLSLNAQPTPIDLGPIGAPANLLYIDPQVLVSHTWAIPIPIWGWIGSTSVTVPNNPLLIHTLVYGQSAGLDAAANAFGVLFANAVEVRIGDPLEQLPVRMLTSSFGASSGSFIPCNGSAPDYGALALRLDGTFF